MLIRLRRYHSHRHRNTTHNWLNYGRVYSAEIMYAGGPVEPTTMLIMSAVRTVRIGRPGHAVR